MFLRKLFLSMTRGDAPAIRMMATQPNALEGFDRFTREAGFERFLLVGDGGTRILVWRRNARFEAEIVVTPARKSRLFGMLPAHSGLTLTDGDAKPEQVAEAISAFYTLSRAALRTHFAKGPPT